MRKIYIFKGSKSPCHFCEEKAKEVISRSYYTDKSGNYHEGKEHWSADQVENATYGYKFPEGTTKWDKYVAFNLMYFDLCKVLDDASILKVAHAFYFDDEDAPENKVYKYVEAMLK